MLHPNPTRSLDVCALPSPTTHACTQLLKRLEDFGDDEAQDIVGAFETKYSKIRDRYKVGLGSAKLLSLNTHTRGVCQTDYQLSPSSSGLLGTSDAITRTHRTATLPCASTPRMQFWCNVVWSPSMHDPRLRRSTQSAVCLCGILAAVQCSTPAPPPSPRLSTHVNGCLFPVGVSRACEGGCTSYACKVSIENVDTRIPRSCEDAHQKEEEGGFRRCTPPACDPLVQMLSAKSQSAWVINAQLLDSIRCTAFRTGQPRVRELEVICARQLILQPRSTRLPRAAWLSGPCPC